VGSYFGNDLISPPIHSRRLAKEEDEEEEKEEAKAGCRIQNKMQELQGRKPYRICSTTTARALTPLLACAWQLWWNKFCTARVFVVLALVLYPAAYL